MHAVCCDCSRPILTLLRRGWTSAFDQERSCTDVTSMAEVGPEADISWGHMPQFGRSAAPPKGAMFQVERWDIGQ